MRTHKGLSVLWILIIIFLFLATGFGVWYFWQSLGSSEATPNLVTTKPSTTSGKIDAALIGTWQTDCLVPKIGDKWAEQHKYTIAKDGAAVHTRLDWGNNDCTGEATGTITDTFKLTTLSGGKINQTWTDYKNTRLSGETSYPAVPGMPNISDKSYIGNVLYDIYQISGSNMKMGWGFRNNFPYGSKDGSTEATRFDTVNDFIIYHKK